MYLLRRLEETLLILFATNLELTFVFPVLSSDTGGSSYLYLVELNEEFLPLQG